MKTELAPSSSINHKFIETESQAPRWIPANCAVRIFSFLSRDQLENARLVCRIWNAIISGPDRQRYQKRRLQAVEISSNHEYSVRAYYNRKIKLLTFKKYFCSSDLSSIEVRSDYRLFGSTAYSYPCSHSFRANTKLNSRFRFSNSAIHGFRSKYCSHKKLEIFNRRVSYKSKIFTPPLDFYVRLQWILEYSEIKSLVFIDFAFTELFVEKFEEYFGAGYQVDKLFIHNCSLKHISSPTFHRFIGHIVKADEYHLEILKNALPNHVNDALLQTPNMLTANVVLISGAATRHSRFGGNGSIPNFNVTEQGFGNYLEKRKGIAVENPSSVFGIQSTAINTQQLVTDYEREYKRQPGPHLFKYIIFGAHKFIATDGDFVIFPLAPNPAQNAQLDEANPNPQHPPQFPQLLQQLQQQNQDDEDEEISEVPKQRIQLLSRIVFENNKRKEQHFDMFNPSPAIVL
ncbi:hypothetical protein M3Y97_00670400 [Aphelenchoides bicaudatus]|nr:hypothetical protein M3Y97_00670400 [Aphelenchoides bicaudatus]